MTAIAIMGRERRISCSRARRDDQAARASSGGRDRAST